MKHTIKIKVTLTRFYEAEVDDTRAASEVVKTLEHDPNPTTIESCSGGTWSLRACRDGKHLSVERATSAEDPERTDGGVEAR